VTEDSLSPPVRRGDPFVAAAKHRPCSCWDGFHYVGHLVLGEDGEEVEVFEAVPCRRYSEAEEGG
jgi:hypothetical protein